VLQFSQWQSFVLLNLDSERGSSMPATSPEEICRLFKEGMAKGDLDTVLSVYDPAAV
jgi:hypothetical protein